MAREHHFGADVYLTRKGAVRAREGDLGIIPGSMGARSFIVRGKGNPGASRAAATAPDAACRAARHAAASRWRTTAAPCEGVACRVDAGVLDETPAAYKPIDAVMRAQEDLVEVLHELRQVVCVKG